MGILLLIVAALIAGLMYYAAFKIEPHWVSKDGRRFLCTAQPVTTSGEAEGRAKETKVLVLDDGALQLEQRRAMRRRLSEMWKMVGKSPDPPRKREVYLLRHRDDLQAMDLMAIRVPSNSRAVPILDEIAERVSR